MLVGNEHRTVFTGKYGKTKIKKQTKRDQRAIKKERKPEGEDQKKIEN